MHDVEFVPKDSYKEQAELAISWMHCIEADCSRMAHMLEEMQLERLNEAYWRTCSNLKDLGGTLENLMRYYVDIKIKA